MRCPCGKGKLPPLSRLPKVGDVILFKGYVNDVREDVICITYTKHGQDSHFYLETFKSDCVSILPTPESEEKCSCDPSTESITNQYIPCPIHGKPKEDKMPINTCEHCAH